MTLASRILRRRASGPAPAPFIVGVGRSGTTLLRLMLDAHPALAIPPETGFVPDLIAATKHGASAEELGQLLAQQGRWGDFGISPDDLVKRWRASGELRPRTVVRAFYEAYAEAAGKPRWGDKTPGYTRHIRLLSKTLPEARFIHLIRDGRDVALSRINTLAQEPITVTSVANRWQRRLTRARRQGAAVEHYREIRYERLVTDPEETLRSICAFLELAWDPVMLDYHLRSGGRLAEVNRPISSGEGKRSWSAASRLALQQRTTKPLDSASVGKWRTQMEPADVAEFEAVAGDLLAELGYPLARP